jgi:protein O-mannosyl-transferase
MGLASLAVALIAVATYAVTLGHGFVFDDGPEVLDNVHIRSTAGVVRILSSPAWSGAGLDENPMYRPATALSYALDHGVWGLSPFGFHLTNVLLHALVSVLVLFLATRCGLTLPGALLAGALFATLPVHVEAVANVAGRKELLVSAFSVGAVLAHDRAMRRGGMAVLLPPLLVAGALFSKESGLAVIGLIGAYELVFGRARWRASPARTASLFGCYLGLTLAFVAARHAVLGTLVFPRTPFDENPIAAAPLSVRIMTAVAVLGRGLLLTVAPVVLSPDYSFAAIVPVVSAVDAAFLGSLLAMVALVLGAWKFRARFPVCGFAALWYAAAVLPASNLLVPIGTVFGERLLYLPSVAVTLVLGAAFAAAVGGRFARASTVAAALLVVAGGVRSVAYARAWSDEPTLFEAGVRGQPTSSKAWRMYGGALMEQGRAAEGEAAFRRAAGILEAGQAPPSIRAAARVELAVALEREGKVEEAERTLLDALALDPGNPDARWRLGVLRWKGGDRTGAVQLWREVADASPRHARALNDLGVGLSALDDLAGAESAWRRAVVADPNLATAWYRLGNLLERRGDLAGARLAWSQFLESAHDRFPEMRDEVSRKLATSSAAR